MNNHEAVISDNQEDSTELHSIDSEDVYSFDEYYLDAYISTGEKKKAYQKACQATGFVPTKPEYLAQYAYAIHKRLERDGLIEKALLDATLMDRIKSRLKLNQLRDEADSEQVQLAAAKHTSGSMYSNETQASGVEVTINRDNVQITHKNQTLTVEDKE